MTGSERVPQSTSEEEKHRTVDTVFHGGGKSSFGFKLCT